MTFNTPYILFQNS